MIAVCKFGAPRGWMFFAYNVSKLTALSLGLALSLTVNNLALAETSADAAGTAVSQSTDTAQRTAQSAEPVQSSKQRSAQEAPTSEATGYQTPANSESAGANTAKSQLKGLISAYDGPNPKAQIAELLKKSLENDQQRQAILKKDKQLKGTGTKALSAVKSVVHYATEYRGFEMSSEGADVILDEKLKLKSTAAVDYAQQKQIDEMHLKITSSMVQMAQGLGLQNPDEQQRAIDSGLNQLKELVGEQEAQNALKQLRAWSAQITVPESVFKQPSWTMMDVQTKTEQVLRDSAQADPVVALVRRALHKYNGHSKFALASAKVINTTLAIAMFSPTVVSPAAQICQFLYQMATGGPEDSKLLTELYLDKRLESRFNRLKQESSQVVNAYNTAILTHNSVLLSYSESVISSMATEETGAKVIGAQRLIARQSTHTDDIDCIQTHNPM